MRFAGKAFVAGFAGWFGAATAIGATVVIVGLVVSSKAKKVVAEFETYLKERTDDLMGDEK